MIKYGIKKIMYSTDDGTIKSEKPEAMEQSHISSGWSAFENPERLKIVTGKVNHFFNLQNK